MVQGKGRRWSVLITITLVMLAGFVISVQAQEGDFSESFNDPGLAGWEHNENVSVVDGVLRLDPGGFAIHGGEWSNYQLSLKLQRDGSQELLVLLNASPAGSYILVVGFDFLLFQREAVGVMQELASIRPAGIPQGKWFDLRLEESGGRVTVYINDQRVLSASDPDPLPGGGIGFEILGETFAKIDQIELHLLDGQAVGEKPAEQQLTAEPLAIGDLQWEHTGGPLGGLGYDVRMRPDNPDIMYVTDAYAGVFISEDGGQNWYASNQGINAVGGMSGDAIPIFCLTIDPTNYDILWAGTQSVRGIFRSADGGKTWQRRDNGVVENNGITFRGFTIDPNDNNIVYAAAEVTGWGWAGKDMVGREFDRVKGVVYKTTNGGQSWSAVWRGNNLARYIWLDPRDSNVLYISTGIFDREAANSDPDAGTPGGEGVIKSIDGGQTWQNINNGLNNLYVGSLFMNPENPDILLAGTGNNQYGENSGVYITTDGGGTWQRTLNDRGGISVELSSSDPKIAYAGDPEGIFRSTDGGWTWLQMNSPEQGWGPPGVMAGFPIDFQVDPRDPNRIFANNYGGGNFLSTDGGATWTVASTGYTGAQVRAIAVDPQDPARVYVAARSGVFISQDGGNQWQGLSYPPARVLEWNAVAIDPSDSSTILTASNWNGNTLKSSDGGRSWTSILFELEFGQSWRTFAYSPAELGVVYAGSGAYSSAGSFNDQLQGLGVYVSANGGNTWQEANDATSQNVQVVGLGLSPADSETVFAAAVGKGLLFTDDGGQNWSRLTEGLPGNYSAISVAVAPDDPNLVFVGLNRQGLYRSKDGGGSWSFSGYGFNPEAAISSIIFSPTNPDVVYAADLRSGVFLSSDRGQTWQPINQGLLTRAVNQLSISSDGLHLYAATEGGGVFRLDLNGQAPVSSGLLIDFGAASEGEVYEEGTAEDDRPLEGEGDHPQDEQVLENAEQQQEIEAADDGDLAEEETGGSVILIGGIAGLVLIILASILIPVLRKRR